MASSKDSRLGTRPSRRKSTSSPPGSGATKSSRGDSTNGLTAAARPRDTGDLPPADQAVMLAELREAGVLHLPRPGVKPASAGMAKRQQDMQDSSQGDPVAPPPEALAWEVLDAQMDGASPDHEAMLLDSARQVEQRRARPPLPANDPAMEAAAQAVNKSTDAKGMAQESRDMSKWRDVYELSSTPDGAAVYLSLCSHRPRMKTERPALHVMASLRASDVETPYSGAIDLRRDWHHVLGIVARMVRQAWSGLVAVAFRR